MFSKKALLLLALGALSSSVSAIDFDKDHRIHHVDPTTQQDHEDNHRLRKHRRDQESNCDAQLSAVNQCVSSSCATCLNNAYDSIFEESNTVTCGLFQVNMCKAINDDCTSCAGCNAVAEDFYECLALRGGCSSFRCASRPTPSTTAPPPPATTTATRPPPPATTTTVGAAEQDSEPAPPSGGGGCQMPDFAQYCRATHGNKAQAACIVGA